MCTAPRIPSLPRKQLRTCQIKDLPTIEPHLPIPLPIRLPQMRQNLNFTPRHLRQPVLAGLRIVPSANPPLPLHRQIPLEIQHQVRARHRSAGEEMLRHPPALEVVGRRFVREVVQE